MSQHEYHRAVILDSSQSGDFSDWMGQRWSLKEFIKWAKGGEPGTACVATPLPYQRLAVARACWLLGNVLMVCDEYHKYGDQSRHEAPIFDSIVVEGRHKGIGLMAITQTLVRIPKIVLANSTAVLAFSGLPDTDIRHLQNEQGEHANDVNALPQYEALQWGNL